MTHKTPTKRELQQGQAFLEYILLLFAVISFFLVAVKGLSKVEITKSFMSPIKRDFAAAFRYGDRKAKLAPGGSGLPATGHIIFNNHVFYDPIIP